MISSNSRYLKISPAIGRKRLFHRDLTESEFLEELSYMNWDLAFRALADVSHLQDIFLNKTDISDHYSAQRSIYESAGVQQKPCIPINILNINRERPRPRQEILSESFWVPKMEELFQTHEKHQSIVICKRGKRKHLYHQNYFEANSVKKTWHGIKEIIKINRWKEIPAGFWLLIEFLNILVILLILSTISFPR